MIQLHCGNSLDVIATLGDDSVDSIVTDPPYGLSQASKRNVRSLSSAMLEVVLPDLADLYAKRFCKAELPFPRDSVLFLDWALRSFGVEARIGVPEGPVDLKNNAKLRQEEVEAAGVGAVGVPDGVLVNEADPALSELLGEYVLSFRSLRHSAFSDCERIGLRQLGPSRFSVPVVIPADSDFARFVLTKSLCGATSLADFVGLEDDALAKSKTASSVVTGAAAELVVVLAFDTATGTCEILPASGASQLNLIAELVSTERVATGAAAGGLPAVFKPHTVRLIGGAADGALTVNFHREFLSCLNSNRGGFMGQAWDYDVPSVDIWQECFRVLKPGGHLLAFAGTRTQHRMAVNIEDAGFEIRDMIAWVYGSGFPKSMNVSKAIDKAAGVRGHDSVGFNVAGKTSGLGVIQRPELRSDHPDYVKPQGITPEGQQWEGWGTALKPSLEPITVARKPFKGTVAANVLEHGTGAINIDGCRVGTEEIEQGRFGRQAADSTSYHDGLKATERTTGTGRWPANLIHDGTDEVTQLFGDARRFFYVPKCNKKDREDGNTHPTVKPTALMTYLVRLVTPPNGVVLDPFMGSGSTGKAAVREGFDFIGIEREEEYVAIASKRLQVIQRSILASRSADQKG